MRLDKSMQDKHTVAVDWNSHQQVTGIHSFVKLLDRVVNLQVTLNCVGKEYKQAFLFAAGHFCPAQMGRLAEVSAGHKWPA